MSESELDEFRKRTSRLLEAFVYDYLKKTGYNETAKTYFREVKLNNWPPTWLEQIITPVSPISPDPVVSDSIITADISVDLDDAINENSNILVSAPNITSSSHATSPIDVNSSSQTPPLIVLQPSNLQIHDKDLNTEEKVDGDHDAVDLVDLQTCGSPRDDQISMKFEELVSASSITNLEIKSEPGAHDENSRDSPLRSINTREKMLPPRISSESSIECESEVSGDQLPDLKLPLEGRDGFLQDWWIVLWENYKELYKRKTGNTLEHY
ncbi:2289_t:CDS:1 [Acaulospora morrowiae]|uniref:2289_t:CDS:1 n=1 Tax=Acaulospora morrowiae TaxID=94023 RepID=A0A9N9GHA6_9GLOM|nr:2289_t:CDS:1 [Acaulospora morrowiae]